MIKHKGNIEKAINEIKGNTATVETFKDAKFIEGKLNGATITLKDLYANKDTELWASSKILEGFKPHYDSTVVQKIKAAGAAIVARVHMDELALGGTGEHSAFGKIFNPLDETRLSGGSSSGSVATFTDNISIAIGSDTGDSVRLPASYTGVFGFKPSYGAISRYGQGSYATSLDTVAYFAHNIEDIITTSSVLFGVDEKDMSSREVEKPSIESVKPKTIGVLTNRDILEDYQVKAYEEFIEVCKNDGIEIKEITLDEKLLELIEVVYKIISYSEASSNDARLNGVSYGNRVEGDDWSETMTRTRTEKLGEMVKRRLTIGSYVLSADNFEDIFIKAQSTRTVITNMFKEALDSVDVLAYPSTPIAPKNDSRPMKKWTNNYLINANLAGTPSLNIPLSKHDNMPFGISLDSSLYSDKKLLEHSSYIVELIGGSNE